MFVIVDNTNQCVIGDFLTFNHAVLYVAKYLKGIDYSVMIYKTEHNPHDNF